MPIRMWSTSDSAPSSTSTYPVYPMSATSLASSSSRREAVLREARKWYEASMTSSPGR